MKRSTPLKRTVELLRRTRLRSMSAKRRAELPTRREVVEAIARRDGYRCRGADLVPEVTCWGPLDPDEWELRSARPGGHLDIDNVWLLCRAHHNWKHAHPIEAGERGLRPRSWRTAT